VQSRIDQLNQIQQMRARAEQQRQEYAAQQPPGSPQKVAEVVDVIPEKKHPDDAHGPKHSFLGVMRDVTCSYPSVLELRVEGPKNSVRVYSNNFSKIDLTVVGFTPKGSMNPCADFNGMKARVQYAEAADKTVDGQVIAIELRK
jgi:hypothetical protein